MSISTIGILLIITIILLLIVIILVIFQFNKISLENARLQQIVSDEKQDMQSNIVLHTKNNILEGFGSIYFQTQKNQPLFLYLYLYHMFCFPIF